MPALRKIHSHKSVARFEQGKKGGEVRVCAGVRLHVGVFRAEELFCAFPRDIFNNIHAPASAVITFAGITLGVFVGKNTAGGKQHRFRNDVFRSDKFHVVTLAFKFQAAGVGNRRIVFFKFVKKVHLPWPSLLLHSVIIP